MSFAYTGRCVLRDETGAIVEVHVIDHSGFERIKNVMAADDYVERGIQPALLDLPDCPE